MNILIIPSWFSNAKSPNAGSFFREEALLMTRGHSVAVLYFERISENKNSLLTSAINIEKDGKLTIFRINLSFDNSTTWDTNLKNFTSSVLESMSRIIKHGFIPDLIHAYSTFMGGIFANWISKAFNIPYVITEHFGPYNPDFLHSGYIKEQMKLAMIESKRLLCVSQFLRQQILMTGINTNPIVVGNYVNDSLFQLSAKKNKAHNLLSIAYYPSFIKDLDTQLMCYNLMLKDGEKFTVTIVGGGEISGGFSSKSGNIIKKKVSEHGLESFVKVIGAANRKEMKRLMDECDIFVSSSIAETFGVSICEAMLCGKPCVLTRNGGSMDFTDPSNSIVVEIHNPKALADGIKKIKHHIDNFQPQIIRNKIKSKYGATAFYERLNKIYEDILSL